MNLQHIAIWLLYNWEFIGIGVTLLAVAYGAMLDAHEERASSASRETRVNKMTWRFGSRRKA